MIENYEYDVYLAHSSHDKPRIRPLANRLRQCGLRVWFDEWIIRPGDDIFLKIEYGLATSRTLLLCISSEALTSDWVSLERNTVLFRDPANKSRKFIPLLLDDCEMPDTIKRYKYIDYCAKSDEAWHELEAILKYPSFEKETLDSESALKPNKENLSQAKIITMEFKSTIPLVEFDPQKFIETFDKILGINASQFKIISIKEGSTIITIESDILIKRKIIQILSSSPRARDELHRLTGTEQTTWIDNNRENILNLVNTLKPLETHPYDSASTNTNERLVTDELSENSRKKKTLKQKNNWHRAKDKHESFFSNIYTENIRKRTISKFAVALRAMLLINEGDSMIIDTGTSMTPLALIIRAMTLKYPHKTHFSIMTHNEAVFDILRESSSGGRLNLFHTGGRYDEDLNACFGYQTELAYETFHPKWVFIGQGGIDASRGLFCHGNTEELSLKKVLARKPAYIRVIMSDYTKLGIPGGLCFVTSDKLKDDVEDCYIITDVPGESLDITNISNDPENAYIYRFKQQSDDFYRLNGIRSLNTTYVVTENKDKSQTIELKNVIEPTHELVETKVAEGSTITLVMSDLGWTVKDIEIC